MSTLSTKLVFGCIAATFAIGTTAFSDPINITIDGNTVTTSGQTVGQAITAFANRYGTPVIQHGALDLNAPTSVSFGESMTSDQAIDALALAAGANAVRVYFVTPADGATVTMGEAAGALVGNRGNISLDLEDVSAKAAILAVAAADNSVVRFPDGAPSGTVTFEGTSIPFSTAVARVATLTKTHWSLGYLLVSTNPSLPSLSSSQDTDSSADGYGVQNGAVASSLPPIKPLARDAEGNVLPFTIHVPVNPKVSASSGSQEAFNYSGIGTNNEQSPYLPTISNDPSNSMYGGVYSPMPDYLGSSYGTGPVFTNAGNSGGFSVAPDTAYGYVYGNP